MRRALKDTAIAGLRTNLEFLYNIFNQDAFKVADFDTGFIEKYSDELLPNKDNVPIPVLALAALSELTPHRDGKDVWDWSDGWLLNLNLNVILTFTENGNSYDVNVTYLSDGFEILVGEEAYKVRLLKQDDNDFTISLNGEKITGKIIRKHEDFTVFYNGSVSYLHHYIPGADQEDDQIGDGVIVTPMPGKVSRIFVESGDVVEEGQSLLVLEAMKMEHTIKASISGTVEFSLNQGMQISDGQVLAKVAKGDSDE
jgi:3-methylcrotonyl-CoA carboxylase alpha subunit